jgi:hypothetical protein
MRTKPWPIVILAVCHFLAPLVNILIASELQSLTVSRYVDLLLKHETFLENLAFFTFFPIAGFAIYSFRKWSYPVFLVVSGWSFYVNYESFSTSPGVYTLPMLIGFYLANFVLVGYFLLPEVKTVYFDPSVRWWESQPRYEITLDASLKSAGEEANPGRILNIARGGIFLQTPKSLKAGQRLIVAFEFGKLKLEVPGEVVHLDRVDATRYGIRFVDLNRVTQIQLRKLISAISWLSSALREGEVDQRPGGLDAPAAFDWQRAGACRESASRWRVIVYLKC